MTEPTGGLGPVKSATRVLDLFESLACWSAARTHSQIAEELGIPKSSLTPLIKTLLQRGYLEYRADRKGYCLGGSIVTLATRISDGNELRAAAALALGLISDETGESCALNVVKGVSSEVVSCVMSKRQRLAIHMSEGDTAPLYATSGGKALLACMSPADIAGYIAAIRFEPITPHTLRSADVLLAQIEEIRRTGFAHVREEFTPGISGIACPVLDGNGQPIASLNIAVPVSRYDAAMRTACKKTLKRAQHLIVERLRRA